MSVCPNLSHPSWKALEAQYGFDGAMEKYIQNGYEIPNVKADSAKVKYSVDGKVYPRAHTMDRLDQNPQLAHDITMKLKQLYPDVNIYEGGLFDEKNNWRSFETGEKGMHIRNAFVGAVAWANDAYLETPPHEYAHEYIDMFRNHPLVKQGIAQYGEEALVEYMGRDFAEWRIKEMQGTPVYGFIKNLWNAIKRFFGNPDVREILAENFKKGTKLTNNVHPGTAVVRKQQANRVLKRIDGTADLGDTYKQQTTEAKAIDNEFASYLLHQEMLGHNVLGMETEFTDVGFLDKEIPINPGEARAYFLSLVKRLEGIDRHGPAGSTKYSNNAGLDTRLLNDFEKQLRNDDTVTDVVKMITGQMEALGEDHPGPRANAYHMALRIMKRINYVKKQKASIHSGKNEFTNLNKVSKDVLSEIREAERIKNETYANMKPWLRKTLKFLEEKGLGYLITPYLTSKFLGGHTDTILHKLFYESLDEAEGHRVRILRGFNTRLQAEEGIEEQTRNWSFERDKNKSIEEYDGQAFTFYAKEDPDYQVEDSPNGDLISMKLTNAEIMNLYLMLRQNEAGHGEMKPPGQAILSNGFYLDQAIDGRSYTKTTKFMFNPDTKAEIVKYVEGNKTMMDHVARIDSAMEYLYNESNETFRQENGYDLPKIAKYFPVYTGRSDVFTSQSMNVVSDFKALRARLGENSPLKILDYNKVLRIHSMQSSIYASHALPIENNRKLIARVKPGLQGTSQERYIDQMEGILNRLENPANLYASQGEKEFNRFMNKINSNFSVAVLSLNIPVMMKQPVSYLAAKEEIDVRYLRQAGWGAGFVAGINPSQIWKSLKVTGVKGGETMLPVEWEIDTSSDLYQRIVKYSPKFAYRFEGAIDRELGEAMMEEGSPNDIVKVFGKRISKSRLLQGIKIFDAATIMGIYRATELETLELHPELKEGSEEFNNHVAKRAEHIVNKTQPTYDLMNRSELSSMSSPFARLLTMFGSARSKLGNLMIEGAIDAMQNKSPEAKQKIRRRIFNVMLLNSLAIVAIDAMRHAILSGFDDDDEVYDFFKYGTIGTAAGGFFGLDVATRVAISRIDNQPWQASIQHPVEAMWEEAIIAATDIARIGKTDKRTGEYDYTIDDGIYKGMLATLKFTGLPTTPLTYPEKLYKKSLEE
jgi:hypothetical protein